jgi:hypothetical protein
MDIQEVEWRAWTDFIYLKIGISEGFSEYGHALSDSIQYEEFLDYMRN